MIERRDLTGGGATASMGKTTAAVVWREEVTVRREERDTVSAMGDDESETSIEEN